MKNKSLLSVLVAGGILMAGCGNTEDTKKKISLKQSKQTKLHKRLIYLLNYQTINNLL